MSSLTSVDQQASKAKCTDRLDSSSDAPLPDGVHWEDTTFGSRLFSGETYSLKWPATRCTSHQPSESSETTMLGKSYDGGTFGNASSVTLQDEFPWHEVDVNKSTQRIPPTIVPALLQGVSDVSPSSRSTLDNAESDLHEEDENSDSGDALPRYSVEQKGKWRARLDNEVVHDNHWIRAESPPFRFQRFNNSVEEWVVHNGQILRDYADRQISLPLGRRLEVSIHEPSRFILGALQLLVNRDQSGPTRRSRQLGSQLIENFVDIDRWAKEYFRSQHSNQVIDSDVPTLLTIVLNSFYEGQVQLIDRLVQFALEHMRFCGRNSLKVEDFSFGFDFKMSHDLPFYVETSSQLREPHPIPAVEVPTTPEPVTTNSGRQVKPTQRAREAVEHVQKSTSARQNKGTNASQVKHKQDASSSTPPARQKKKSPTQISSDCTTPETPTPRVVGPGPPKTTAGPTKHRPTRPSNLGLPPISPGSSSTSGTLPPPVHDSTKSKPGKSALAESPKASGSFRASPKNSSLPRLKIKLPARSLKNAASSDSGLTLSNSKSTATNTSGAPIQGRVTRRSGRTRPGGPRSRGGGRECVNKSRMQSAQTPETTSADANAPPAVQSAGTGDIVASSAVNAVASVAYHTTPVDAGDETSSVRPDKADDSTGKPLPDIPPTGPSHPRRKKRKLDDCEG